MFAARLVFTFKNVRDSKIRYLGDPSTIQENVFRFQVTMNDIVLMKIGQTMKDIDEVKGGMEFIKMSVD